MSWQTAKILKQTVKQETTGILNHEITSTSCKFSSSAFHFLVQMKVIFAATKNRSGPFIWKKALYSDTEVTVNLAVINVQEKSCFPLSFVFF